MPKGLLTSLIKMEMVTSREMKWKWYVHLFFYLVSLYNFKKACMYVFIFFTSVMNATMRIAIRECHNEQLSLANSLKDLDSAVGRLDNILMTM